MRQILVSLLLICSVSIAYGDTLVGNVVRVVDGDTVVLLDSARNQYRIRLAGIDAPEKKQPWGQRSKQSLSSLVFQHAVSVEWHKLDRYGRLIGKITVNGSDVNLEQITRGMAWHYKKYEREQTPDDRVLYARVEHEAQEMKVGLWSDPNPIPPWEWRKRR